MQLRYFSHAAIEELNNSVDDRIEWYYGTTLSSVEADLSVQSPIRDTGIEYEPFAADLSFDLERPTTGDAPNALLVYRSLAFLTPHQASEERLWTFLAHQECAEYVAHRWLLSRKRPESQAEAARRARNHFFVSGNRGLIRDNGLSRLWWMGFIAQQADPNDPLRFLNILLYLQDVRSALIERPSTSMNYRVLRVIYARMRENFEDEGKSLFTRDRFREWMKNLNRRGGVLLLDAMPDDALSQLIRDESERALQSVS